MDDDLTSHHRIPPQGLPRPNLLIFDVNETLSDMSPLRHRFDDVGAPSLLLGTWFASLLRDGFALTVAGLGTPFAQVAAEALRVCLSRVALTRRLDDAVDHIMAGFADLGVHDDVADGVCLCQVHLAPG